MSRTTTTTTCQITFGESKSTGEKFSEKLCDWDYGSSRWSKAKMALWQSSKKVTGSIRFNQTCRMIKKRFCWPEIMVCYLNCWHLPTNLNGMDQNVISEEVFVEQYSVKAERSESLEDVNSLFLMWLLSNNIRWKLKTIKRPFSEMYMIKSEFSTKVKYHKLEWSPETLGGILAWSSIQLFCNINWKKDWLPWIPNAVFHLVFATTVLKQVVYFWHNSDL